MLIYLPALILLVAAVALLVLHWTRPGFGFSWLLAVVSVQATWFLLVFLRFRLTLRTTVSIWNPEELFPLAPSLILDRYSWPYAFALVTLAVAVMYTTTAREKFRADTVAWAGALGTTGLGLVAVLSANPVTMVLAWTALDLLELGVQLVYIRDVELQRRAVTAFAARVIGSFVMVLAMVASRSQGEVMGLEKVNPVVGLLVLLSAGLRLGVLPLHLPFARDLPVRRGLGLMLRMVMAASSLVVLARLQGAVVLESSIPYLLALTVLAALVGSILWVASQDELSGRPYWVITLAALAIACVIKGNASASISWGITLLLGGGMIFLYTARETWTHLFPGMMVLLMMGLPYTPTADGYRGLFSGPFSAVDVFFILSIVLLAIGYLRHSLRPGDSLKSMERWVLVTYPLGLLLITATQIVEGIWGWPTSQSMGVWWASAVAVVLSAGAVVWGWRNRALVNPEASPEGEWLGVFTRPAERAASILRLDWLYGLLERLGNLVGWVIARLTNMLEGDGGVLWALVLLALLVLSLQSGGNPR
jgi:hypothetical protein